MFVDESGADQRSGYSKLAWAPVGQTPTRTTTLGRTERWQILPAYHQDGVICSRVYLGSTDLELFEDFFEKDLLPLMQPWPAPKSVLVMDNASFHKSERIETLCAQRGVKLEYLPPYSCDLNPIEEFFSELKTAIRQNWRAWNTRSEEEGRSYGQFLNWCIEAIGGNAAHARAHFGNYMLSVEEYIHH